MAVDEEVILRGLPISSGVGIGFPVFLARAESTFGEAELPKKEIENEISRYRKALDSSRKDVENLKKISQQDGPPEVALILGTHLEIMQDPLITSEIENRIRKNQPTKRVLYDLIEECKQRFTTMRDHYFAERVRDIVDVSKRILGHLCPADRLNLAEMPHNSILIAQELVPSETVEASATLISAFVTAAGGLTSHAAIVARAKGIPYVANIDIKRLDKLEFHTIIVDGSQGIVVLNPTRQTLKKYQELKKNYSAERKILKTSAHLHGETIDGYEVRIFANLENPKEIDAVLKNGASGIGLFRSEYLFLSKRQFPTEEEQFEIYKKMVKSLRGGPLVIRVFDVGGDKRVDFLPEDKDAKYFRQIGVELNPALGCRAIRFLLRYPELLYSQLRAILRATRYGPIQILIPMISDISELQLVRQMLDKARRALVQEGVKIAKDVPVGCMIEVPSSAIMCDSIAEETDFFSIGTNDLIQYVLAADRSNFNTSELYSPIHPSIFRLIRMVVNAANRSGKPVIVCGESAADPLMIPILLGLGVREFSVAFRHIPLVKHTIRKWRILEACRLTEGAMEFSSALELKKFLVAETAR